MSTNHHIPSAANKDGPPSSNSAHENPHLNQTGEVLEAFINALPLDPPQIKSLGEKRAIPETWARKMKLRRVNVPLVQKAIDSVIGQFGASAARAARLIDESDQPVKALLSDNDLIPYIAEDGRVTKVRPHKFGLPGDPVAVYCPFLLSEARSQEIVLTEGEFKAIAACAVGIPCIAAPGISAFVGKHYPDLIELLKRHGVRSVTVCFDNTDPEKSDPAYPSGSDDTNFYAYLLARKLEKDGF